MMKTRITVAIIAIGLLSLYSRPVEVVIHHFLSVDSLGACQGVHYQHGKVYLYGDREIGMMREDTPGKTPYCIPVMGSRDSGYLLTQ